MQTESNAYGAQHRGIHGYADMKIVTRHYHDIKSDNPSLWLLFRHVEAEGVAVDQFSPSRILTRRYAVYHLHWLDKHLSRPRWWAALGYTLLELAFIDIARAKGARVVWTAHNAQSHERWYPRLERWCWRAMLKRVDAFISFTQAGREVVHERHPQTRKLPSFVVRDGHFRDAYPNTVTRLQARRGLNIAPEARVVLLLGAIRAYKNVPALIAAFRASNERDHVLLIAGAPKPATLGEQIRVAAGDDVRVRVVDRFVADADIQRYMNAADLVALPYADILNSGSALLALSFHRPILVTDKAPMRELAALAGADWVRLFSAPLATETLTEALDWACAAGRPRKLDFDWGQWPELAAQMIDVYRRLAA